MPVNVSAVRRKRLEVPVCCLYQEDTYCLIVFLILNLIYFLSNFVSSTVCLHKESPSAHIAVGRSFDCAFYEIEMSLFEAFT